MNYKSSIFPILLATALLWCVDLSAQSGGSSVPFLLISPDARASGRGETGTGLADDINAIYWNPAGLGFLDYFPNLDEYAEPEDIPYTQFALSYSPWLPQFNADLNYAYGTFGKHIPEYNGTFAANIIFMNLGQFTRTSEDGRNLGTFNSYEFTFGLSYGTIIAKDFAIGAQGRFIYSSLTPFKNQDKNAGNGMSVSFDLGALWKPTDLGFMEDRFSLGFNLQNIGPKITYVAESDPLPTDLRIGTAIKVYEDEYNDLTVLADYSKLLVYRDSTGNSDPVPISFITAWKNPGAEWAAGAEYWYNKIFALRAGYFFEPSHSGGRKFWNFGVGIKYDIFKLDFSFINTIEENHPLANTMRFSFLVDFD